MKVAVCQAAAVAGSKEKALAILARQARRAASDGAGLLVFPELFLTGYGGGGALAALAEPADGPSAARAAAIARREGIAILYGFPEREGDRLYDAALLVDQEGRRRGGHRKLHLYGAEEKRLFTPGDAWTIVDLEGWRIGVLICLDVEFPEAVRRLALAGAELVLVPAALPRSGEIVARSVVAVRAFENQVFLAYADLCGEEGGIAFCGRSAIVGPEGDVLARARGRKPGLIAAALDRSRLAAARRSVFYLAERRPGLYGKGASSRAADAFPFAASPGPAVRIEVCRSMIWQMTSTLVICGRSALVVDPGVFPAEVEAIRRRIPAGVKVEALFFTHAHWDHVVGHFAFPGVPVYASTLLARSVAESGKLARAALEEARRHDGEWYVERPGGYSWPQELRGLEDGFHFNVGDLDVEVLGLPGHAPEALGLRVEGTLVVGDYLSPLEIPFVDDLEAYRRTLQRLLGLLTSGIERVIPGHGPELSAAEARRIAGEDRLYLDRLARCREKGDAEAALRIALPRAADAPGMAGHHRGNCRRAGLVIPGGESGG